MFNFKLKHINTDALSMLPIPPDLTEENKRKAWKSIAEELKKAIKTNGVAVSVKSSLYSDIPYEELKHTLETQGYRLTLGGDSSFNWDDYHTGITLYIRW